MAQDYNWPALFNKVLTSWDTVVSHSFVFNWDGFIIRHKTVIFMTAKQNISLARLVTCHCDNALWQVTNLLLS